MVVQLNLTSYRSDLITDLDLLTHHQMHSLENVHV